MRRGGAYDRSVRAFSAVYVAIGVVILAMTIARGGGPASVGVLIGLAFIAIGVGRYFLQRKMAREEESSR
ncbi:MAG: hypothetical protein KDB64_04690 [Solirubrobacterales bacterium]|nr:hypothetical protein [Solirubrobacterales bacterium]MCB0862404.1 hypothetical protein [Solirubrobacterales bacterium]MCB8916159.1 hypothetical protein [Thermoleophilales bacterium]